MAVAIFALAVGIVAPASGERGVASSGAFTCRVGKSVDAFPANLGGGLRISDERDVGCGRQARERVAIVGYVEHYHGQRKACFNLERPNGGSVGIGCPGEIELADGGPCPGFCVHAFPTEANESHPPLHTVVTAGVPTGTARVTVKAGAGERAKTVEALVAPVEGALLEAFGEDEPIVVAAAVVGGCYRAKGVRVLARGADGKVLARDRGFLSFPGQCHRVTFPPLPGEAASKLRITVE